MAELLDELADIPEEKALTAAAYFHARFENIHPFADGYGRTGRQELEPLISYLREQTAKTWEKQMRRRK